MDTFIVQQLIHYMRAEVLHSGPREFLQQSGWFGSESSCLLESYLKKLFGPNKDRMSVDQMAVLLVSKVNESKKHGWYLLLLWSFVHRAPPPDFWPLVDFQCPRLPHAKMLANGGRSPLCRLEETVRTAGTRPRRLSRPLQEVRHTTAPPHGTLS